MHVLALCGGFWCAPERPSVDGGAGAALAVRAWMRKGAGVVMGCRSVSNGVGHWVGPPKPYTPNFWLSNQGDDDFMSEAQRRRLSGSCGLGLRGCVSGRGGNQPMLGRVCWASDDEW